MENTLPSVTVATVTYNAEKTLQATLESVVHKESLVFAGHHRLRQVRRNLVERNPPVVQAQFLSPAPLLHKPDEH